MRPRLPELKSGQMVLVDEIVLATIRRPTYNTRARIVAAVCDALDDLQLPHRDYTAIVRMSLQRLRAAGDICTAGGGNAIWMVKA